MKEVVNTVVILNVLGLNVSDMYKVERYYNTDEEILENYINDFCKDGKYELVAMCTTNGYSITVVYKKIKDEN